MREITAEIGKLDAQRQKIEARIETLKRQQARRKLAPRGERTLDMLRQEASELTNRESMLTAEADRLFGPAREGQEKVGNLQKQLEYRREQIRYYRAKAYEAANARESDD